MVRAQAATVESATAEQKRAAQKVCEAADELYEGGRYEEAAQAFRASYELVSSPNSRLMWARALREVKRFDEARRQYEGTILDAQASGGRYPEAQRAAEAELEALTQSLAYINVKAPSSHQPVEVRIDGRTVPWTTGERMLAPASRVRIELRFADGTVQEQDLELRAGETRDVIPESSTPPKRQEPKPATVLQVSTEPRSSNDPMRTAAYVSGAVGIAGLATFTVFGILNRSTYSDLESKCASGVCSSAQMDEVDAGRRYQAIANVGLGAGVLGTAAAVTFYVISTRQGSRERAATFMIGPGSLNLAGRF